MPAQPQHRGVLGAASRHSRAPVQACERPRSWHPPEVFLGLLQGASPFDTAQDAVKWRLEERLGTVQTRNYLWD